jgi:hypothetical protein
MSRTSSGGSAEERDPVLARRARIASLVHVGKRVGYGLYLVAVALFAVGLAAGYTTATTTAIVACLVVGSLVLAPAIVFGYAVRAAEREDRDAAAASPSAGTRRASAGDEP